MVNYLKHERELYRIPPLVDAVEYSCLQCKYKGHVSVAEIIDQSMKVLSHTVSNGECPGCTNGRLRIITDTVLLKSHKHMILIDASCNKCAYGTFKKVDADMTSTGGARY